MIINCPCGTNTSFENCCGKFIQGEEIPKTPEELMRSRYTAYTLGEVGYIIATMQGRPAKSFNLEETKAWLASIQWTGLKVIKYKLKNSNLGYVWFEAQYTSGGIKQSICEKSEFRKIVDRWMYTGGKPLNPNIDWSEDRI